MKRSLNDFGAFDKDMLSKKRWIFQAPDGREIETHSEHWFPARADAARKLGVEPSQLSWKEIP